MTRGGMHWRLASTTLAAAALVAACSERPPDVAADPASSPPRSTPSASSPSASTPSASSSRSAPPEVPAPGHLTRPASSAGPLSRSSFPTPEKLGVGWRYSVDPGDAEEGYLGNGTPALARDPQEVVQSALPFGCPRPAALPGPQHALEVDYTYRRTKVIAVRLSFAGAAPARTFYDRRRVALAACRGRSGGRAIGVLVTRVDQLTSTAVLSDRTPTSDPWSELAVLDRDDVVLVAAQTPPGRPPLAGRQARELARSFQP